ncbi:Clp protease N-terminal domain-containing protein [Gryllotalpicola koreensis]|uniref:Clp R domain-containing protein n=1 Tax=Gryllotalpicola koreensis TaxID=993086 RepID=A0ABP8A9R1_9MICO
MSASTDGRTGGHQGRSGQSIGAEVRALVRLATAEAERRGLPAVEAEHLMLALLAGTGSTGGTAGTGGAAAVLAAEGLDYDTFARALIAERENSLRAAGVEPVPADRLVSTGRQSRARFGTSARQALVAAHRVSASHRRHNMRTGDVAAGILSSSLGTVPRALAYAGLDRSRLLQAVVSATQEA